MFLNGRAAPKQPMSIARAGRAAVGVAVGQVGHARVDVGGGLAGEEPQLGEVTWVVRRDRDARLAQIVERPAEAVGVVRQEWRRRMAADDELHVREQRPQVVELLRPTPEGLEHHVRRLVGLDRLPDVVVAGDVDELRCDSLVLEHLDHEAAAV
jgi:hypothetical protein